MSSEVFPTASIPFQQTFNWGDNRPGIYRTRSHSGVVTRRKVSGGQYWSFSAKFNVLGEANAKTISAFLKRHDNGYEPFNLRLSWEDTPRGSFAGSPQVASGQTGNSINLTGFTANQSGVALEDDLIQFPSDTKVYQVINDGGLDSDGSGNATAEIYPSVIVATTTGAVVSQNIDFYVTAENAQLKIIPRNATSMLYQFTLDFEEFY